MGVHPGLWVPFIPFVQDVLFNFHSIISLKNGFEDSMYPPLIGLCFTQIGRVFIGLVLIGQVLIGRVLVGRCGSGLTNVCLAIESLSKPMQQVETFTA